MVRTARNARNKQKEEQRKNGVEDVPEDSGSGSSQERQEPRGDGE